MAASWKRFTAAHNSSHEEFPEKDNKAWRKPFFFVQLADTQLGMLSYMRKTDPTDWTE
jgi:hypothetical protein